MQADPSKIKEVYEAAKPQFPKQGVPCRLLAPETSNDMVGQNKSFWDNTPFGYRVLYHYPLRDIMEDSFKNMVYEIFIPPGGNVLESFELSIKPSLSQMQIYDDTVNYRLDIYATFSEPGGKLVESFHLNESASGKLTSADKVPDIVYQTVNKLALELMRKMLDSKKVVETIRGRSVASHAPEVKTTQVQPPPATPSVVMPSVVTLSSSGPGLRYAIVVGIKDYQNRGKWNLNNLRYASKDARAFADYLRSPQGGHFDKVEVLTDEQATTIAIRDAMKEKLREVREDDFVVVFWAGHGSPDPHDEKTLYLITHDTDPEHMASTAYPMAEFKADIAKIKARQVLVIADTCYSAGIADPSIGLRGTEEANTIVEGMRGITAIPTNETGQPQQPSAAAVPMRMIFTSCEQGEKSRESSEIGTDSNKGFGVFTFFLIESLKGAGDKAESGGDGNGIVTLGEAIETTRDKVIRYTKNQQHPATAGSFDRNIIMEKIK